MEDETFKEIEKIIKENRISLFMKGNKNFPQCGYSSDVVNILKMLGVEFKDINVLKNPLIRTAIKKFSSWPTIPQLYVDQKFIGGADIVTKLHQDNKLSEILGI